MAIIKTIAFAFFVAGVTVQAQFSYKTNDGSITITGYTGAGGDVTIPDTITDLPVTSIGDRAFFNCLSLRSVTLGTNITRIGNYAFFFCSNLASVLISNSVTSIREGAFYNCTGLTNLTVPTSVTNTGDMAFWYCTNLNYTTIPNIGTNKAATVATKTHWRNLNSSYADLVVEPLLPQFGYACEVGANDGIRESNTLPFENKGWTVLCIEPNPLLTVALSHNRKLWRAVACGSERADDMEFAICGAYPYDGSSGFHTGTGAYPCPNPQIVHVKVLPLRDVLKDVKFPRLDLLSIDVEGHELEVLKGKDFTKWHPKFVIVEDTHNADAIAKYLKSFGYVSWAHRLTDNIYVLSSLMRRPSPSLIATGLFIVSAAAILLSLPLILRRVKMNGVYGVRIAEASRSQERWFQINRFGGALFLLWGVAVGITAAFGLALERSQWLRYSLISAGVVVGGMVLVTIGILVYAAKTQNR